MPEYTKPVSMVNLTFQDASRELSSVGFNIEPLTAGNFVANMAAKDAVIAAIRNVTLCNPFSSMVGIDHTMYNMDLPTSEYAQREIALQVGFHDTTNGKKGHLTIPGVDWAALKGQGDEVDYANVQWLALAAALNLTAKSADGNAIVVDYGRLVGRRS